MRDINKLTISPIQITSDVLNYIDSYRHNCLECDCNYLVDEDVLREYGYLAFQLCEDCIPEYKTATQYCNCCESEIELLNTYEVQNCPICDNEVYPCSLCDMDKVKCSECIFDKKLTVVRAMKNILTGHLVQDNEYEYLKINKCLHHRVIGTKDWVTCPTGLNVAKSYEVIK